MHDKKYLNVFNRNNIVILISSLYLFFWDLFLTLGIKFDFRTIIFVLFFYIISDFYKDIRKKNYNFIYICLFLFFFTIFHSFLFDNLLNKKFYLSLIFLIYIFGVAYYLGETILLNKNKIIYLFISLFLISILINYLHGFSSNPEPFSCGALKNLIGEKNNFHHYTFFIHFLSSYSLIYSENSHLAMSGVPVFIYSLYFLTHKSIERNYLNVLILILFVVVLFLKSSATLLAGSIFSLLSLIIFEYKRLNRYFIFFSLVLCIFLTIIFFGDKTCKNKIKLNHSNAIGLEKINPFSKTNNFESLINEIKDLKNYKDVNFQENLALINLKIEEMIKDDSYSEQNKKILIKIKKILNQCDFDISLIEEVLGDKLIKNRENKIIITQPKVSSLSSDVFFHAMKVTYDSLLTKPFGWGFQGYELAFDNYNKKNNQKIFRKSLMKYNNKDASSNLFKLISEFGILTIILFLFLLYVIFSKKIALENKVFLFPFIITQLIRGAGYFNGGFILILFILLVIQFKISKTK